MAWLTNQYLVYTADKTHITADYGNASYCSAYTSGLHSHEVIGR
jgi:hypothetical protein